MSDNQDVIWRELARLAGVCDGTKLNLINLLYVSKMALGWTRVAQGMYVAAESERMIEKLDAAAREVRRQVVFSVFALGIGTAINAALLLRAGASVAPIVRGGVQLWTAAGPTRALALPGSLGVWAYAAQNPLYAAGYTLTQLIASAVPGAAILTAARVDSDPAGPRFAIAEMQRSNAARAAYGEYEKALQTTLARGFEIGSSESDHAVGVIRIAAANGMLNDVRLRIEGDIERLVRNAAGLTPAQRQMAKLRAKIDLWLQIHWWCDERIPGAISDYLSHLRAMLRRLEETPGVAPEELERIRTEIRDTQNPGLRYSASAG